MASGSQLMTTYYAKRIIGDNAASTADQALLQTGQGIITDTWILNRTNRSNYGILYHYDSNGADKIKFVGGIDNNNNDIETAWIQLGTGDTHILGRVGIGEDPTINNNSYKLYINGTTYTNAPVYINNSTAVAMAGDDGALVIGDKAGLNIGIDNCKIHARDNSAAANLLLNSEGGNITLGVNDNNYYVNIRSVQDASSTSTGALRVGGGAGIAKKLYVGDDIHSDGHLYFAAAKRINMNYNNIDYPILENSNDSNIILNAATGILNIGYKNTTGINMYYSTDNSTRTQFFTINSDGAYANTRFGVNGQDTNYTLYVNGTSFFNNNIYLAASLDLTSNLNLYTNSDDSPDIIWWYADKEQEQAQIWMGSGDTSIFAPNYRCYASDGTSLYSGNLVIGDGTGVTNAASFRSKLSTWALISSSYNTFMPPDGTTNAWYKFGTADGYGILPALSGGAESGHSSIGTSSWYWKNLYVDRAYTGKITIQQPAAHRDNGIVGTYDYTKAAAIWSMGASYQIKADGSGLGTLYGAAYGYGGRDYLGSNGYAGGHQFLWCENGAVRVALGDNIWTAGKVTASGGFVGALTGNVTGNCSGSSGSCTGNAATATKVGESTSWLYFHHSNEVNFGGTNSNAVIYFGYRAVDSRGKPTDFVFGSGSGTANIKAAKVYNAVWNDYAEYRRGEVVEGGYCVTETSNGILQKTIERLQPACHLTSDTWGTIMGKTKDAKTPIAVAGRVLAYPYRIREYYHLGDALCSAPGGTVDIMTREEIREYPERIVGIVSEIPDYEIWHAGAQDGNHEIEVKGRIWIYVR